MKVHKGGLVAYLNGHTQEKAATFSPEDVNQGGITQIDVHDLVRNERNFYGIRDVEELASMIAASGVVEPLTVTPIGDGKYRIVAGERRASATLLRLERGDLIDPKLPCIVKKFVPSGSLDAQDMEMLCLIVSNRGQRQTRTALEKLKEIQELEPIIKKIYKDENIQGSFRRYFADSLSVSDSQLQRLKSLANLIPDAQRAVDMGLIGDTAAMELSSYSEEEQSAYIQFLFEDNIKSRVKDIKSFFATQEEVDPTDNEFDYPEEDEEEAIPPTSVGEGNEYTAPAAADDNEDTVEENPDEEETEEDQEGIVEEIKPSVTSVSNNTEKKERKKQDASTGRSTNATINLDLPIPQDMNGEQMEHEADTWIETILTDSIRIAKEKTDEAREAGENKIAALWDSRRAKAVLVLETVRE